MLSRLHFSFVPLGAYVLWLLSFPMQGFALQGIHSQWSLPFFLVPTVLCFFTLALLRSIEKWRQFSALGALCSAAATMLAAIAPEQMRLWLVLAGLGSPFALLRACQILRDSPHAVFGAGIALVSANALMAALQRAPIPPAAMLALLSLLPLFSLRTVRQLCEEELDRKLFILLPFVLTFYLLGGLLYGAVIPRYAAIALAPGLELAFYMAAVLLAARIAPRHPDLVLAVGIICAMASVSFLSLNTLIPVHLGAFFIQGGFGFVDVFVLGIMLSGVAGIRTGALVAGTMCLGIAAGESVIRLSGRSLDLFTIWGNLILTTAVLMLYFIGKKRRAVTPDAPTTSPFVQQPDHLAAFPPGILARLSLQERAALEQVLKGKTFKDAAAEMGVSLSTVKTYMRRVYEKLNVSGKEEMLQKYIPPNGLSDEPSGGMAGEAKASNTCSTACSTACSTEGPVRPSMS
jgi:DNA-binding CsgD family transcriptional regulator